MNMSKNIISNNKLIQLKEEGFSQQEISKETGLSKSVISKRLKKINQNYTQTKKPNVEKKPNLNQVKKQSVEFKSKLETNIDRLDLWITKMESIYLEHPDPKSLYSLTQTIKLKIDLDEKLQIENNIEESEPNKILYI